MKKSKIIIVVTALFFLLFTSTVFASTKTWLIDEDGKEQSGYNVVEIGDSVELGKIRFRQDNETVGLLKEGDRITITLRNALFNSPPKLENPIPSGNNVAGQTGKFFLVPIEDYSNLSVNSITYKLVEKTPDEYGYAYENIDYVINLNDIKPVSVGEVLIEFSSNSPIVLTTGPIVSNTALKVANIVKQNTVTQENYVEKFIEEDLSVDIKKILEENESYVIDNFDIKIEYPENFFYTGQMWNFFSEYNPFNLITTINKYSNLKFTNSDFSVSAGVGVYEINSKIFDRVSKKEFLIGEGSHYDNVIATIRLLSIDDEKIKKLVPIKYIEEKDGSLTKKLFTSGTYNPRNREYSFNIDGPGFYSLELKDVNNVSMVLDDIIARVNGAIIRLDVRPTLINNSTYVPIRFIAENLGAEVEFLQATNQVEIKTGEKTIYLPIDKVTAELATPARIIEGRTMVPVRYVSEQLGATVTYFADTRKIEIIK